MPTFTIGRPQQICSPVSRTQLRRLYGSGLHVETLDLPTDRAELAVSTQRALEVTSEGTPGAAPGQEQKGPADTNGDISAVKTDKVASNPTVSQPKTDVLVVDFVPTDPDWIFDAMRLFKVQVGV
ncbi:hypothetical protein SARC_01463 [Sphaeroforma arctica JP610]|uniref:Uncharacterized protein n=1 Tax=Sphaeroforma arctica JP610 TaxID=667725 RepID=A0A0L0GBU6_9EUKA|nr:hypothetical protein SARC_01463 [Sphaeroforma arctica JP610]KNC86366.1 hypothetical protein SARC_01463 [Sphaeroforma arctica JP610]|eukprot:XP_014160268.1 hypothetical protein SARC_01463 [Sphaeroforma arctica JP610]